MAVKPDDSAVYEQVRLGLWDHRMCVCMYVCMCVQVCVYACVCMCMCVCVCMCVSLLATENLFSLQTEILNV